MATFYWVHFITSHYIPMIPHDIPSGNAENHRLFFVNRLQTSTNGPSAVAMLDYQRVSTHGFHQIP